MMAHSLIRKDIQSYIAKFVSEKEVGQRFLDLIEHPDAFQRTHLPGHITGSAFIVSENFTHTLLVHHGKLNRWLQPGGHADGDIDVMRVATREANEETGVAHLDAVTREIFDLDIHPIPERKDFPGHDHYDIRYLFKASMADRIVVSEESHDVRWVNLDELERYNAEPSLLRLREKLPVRTT
jgi:8-oxo-dGTP pyrophosphatase MutT (NUDIX family)